VKPLAITLGDPAGIGAEVVFDALSQLEHPLPVRIFGSLALAAEATPLAMQFRELVDDCGGSGPLRPGVVDAGYGRIALVSINAALSAIRRGECSALVTAPIHKQAIVAAGSSFHGHTELLAADAGLSRYGYDYAMYFDSPRLRTVLLSVHLPLREAIARIDAGLIAATCALTERSFTRLYGRPPSIAVAGVNPHAGEGGMFGSEEEIIREGVARAGGRVSGPHPPDTVFRSAMEGRYDVVLAMYHDQGLIPIKTLDFEHSVNVTLGLPYLRCSVDHGTAFDIAGKGVADSRPMRYAIEWAAAHAEAFQ
jgi:4-hydroxythreonine-4-phosphate dehydrogenase